MILSLPTLSAQKNEKNELSDCLVKAQKAYSKQKYPETVRQIDQCLSQDSLNAGYWMLKAESLKHMGKENLAQAYFSYQKVLNLSSNSSAVYNNLFVLAAKQGKWGQGLKYLLKGHQTERHEATNRFFAYKIQVTQTLTLFKIL